MITSVVFQTSLGFRDFHCIKERIIGTNLSSVDTDSHIKIDIKLNLTFLKYWLLPGKMRADFSKLLLNYKKSYITLSNDQIMCSLCFHLKRQQRNELTRSRNTCRQLASQTMTRLQHCHRMAGSRHFGKKQLKLTRFFLWILLCNCKEVTERTPQKLTIKIIFITT